MQQLDDNIFYNMDKAIRTYRQFAHQKLNAHGFDITIDQWLVLKALQDNASLTQHELATLTFKDQASFTRIVELLVKKGYLQRIIHPDDLRRFSLSLTGAAVKALKNMEPVIQQNREQALMGFNDKTIASLRKMLHTITTNCIS